MVQPIDRRITAKISLNSFELKGGIRYDFLGLPVSALAAPRIIGDAWSSIAGFARSSAHNLPGCPVGAYEPLQPLNKDLPLPGVGYGKAD